MKNYEEEKNKCNGNVRFNNHVRQPDVVFHSKRSARIIESMVYIATRNFTFAVNCNLIPLITLMVVVMVVMVTVMVLVLVVVKKWKST